MRKIFDNLLIFAATILLALLPITQASGGKIARPSEQTVLEQSDDTNNSQNNLETKDTDSVGVINWQVLSNGGTTSISLNYKISGTLSQSGIGFSSTPSEDVNLHSGYWQDLSVSGLLCGDMDYSGNVDIDDVVFIINYMFAGGPAPDPFEVGNVNCLDAVDMDDIVFIINYMFAGGSVPCEDCPLDK